MGINQERLAVMRALCAKYLLPFASVGPPTCRPFFGTPLFVSYLRFRRHNFCNLTAYCLITAICQDTVIEHFANINTVVRNLVLSFCRSLNQRSTSICVFGINIPLITQLVSLWNFCSDSYETFTHSTMLSADVNPWLPDNLYIS